MLRSAELIHSLYFEELSRYGRVDLPFPLVRGPGRAAENPKRTSNITVRLSSSLPRGTCSKAVQEKADSVGFTT